MIGTGPAAQLVAGVLYLSRAALCFASDVPQRRSGGLLLMRLPLSDVAAVSPAVQATSETQSEAAARCVLVTMRNARDAFRFNGFLEHEAALAAMAKATSEYVSD